jgi:hypothetical protein
MATLTPGDSGQQTLGGFGTGSVVQLDGGKRVRLDDLVDFWPATGAWRAIEAAPNVEDTPSGIGMSSMLQFLRQQRALSGAKVADGPVPLRASRCVICNHCGQPAQWHDGRAVYPDRKDLYDRRFWVCWGCDAWVGCHRNSDHALGPLAKEDLRAARSAAHRAFDPVWQSGRMERSQAYDWLAQALEIPRARCHIGMLQMDECLRVSGLVWQRFGRVGEAKSGDIDF